MSWSRFENEVVDLYLDALFAAEPHGGLIELRVKREGRVLTEFYPCTERPTVASRIAQVASRGDLYIGVAPRRPHERDGKQFGGKAAVERVHALWADCDTAEATKRLHGFDPEPPIVIRSGSGGRHAYWPLWPPVPPGQAELANRRLADLLAADARATDAARVLRPPGTFNFKPTARRDGRPTPVTLERVKFEIFTVQGVVGELELKPEPTANESTELTGLRAIPPPLYVERLTGQRIGVDGKIHCPFADHDDRTPSLHVFGEPARGVYCFGCGRGGDLFGFAALLWGLDPRRDFPEIRWRLLKEFKGG